MTAKDETKQANFRVPSSAVEVVKQVAARLRSDPAFADQLVRLLENAGGAGLVERIEHHEQRIRHMEGQIATLLAAHRG